MLKAILWDNDGVLVDTETIFFEANRQTLAGRGISLTRQQLTEISLERGESVIQLAETPGTAAYDRLRRRRDDLYGELLSREPLATNGIREVLEALRGKYVMGIVTSCPREHFEIIHRRSGLLPYFHFALAYEDCEYAKPHPAPYLKAVERTGCSAEECLVVEDSPRGLASAVSAGIRCVVIPSHFTRNSNFPGAWKVLNDIQELPAVLEEI